MTNMPKLPNEIWLERENVEGCPDLIAYNNQSENRTRYIKAKDKPSCDIQGAISDLAWYIGYTSCHVSEKQAKKAWQALTQLKGKPTQVGNYNDTALNCALDMLTPEQRNNPTFMSAFETGLSQKIKQPTQGKQDALDEVWKPVVENDEYLVSNLGNVKGKRGKLMKPQDTNGYQALSIKLKDGSQKRLLVHRIVARAFIGECPHKYCVAHLDGDRQNNKLDNLKYCTYKENESHKKLHGTFQQGENASQAILTDNQVLALRELFPIISKGKKYQFYQCFDLYEKAIIQAIRGHSFKHLPNHITGDE